MATLQVRVEIAQEFVKKLGFDSRRMGRTCE